MTLKLLPLIVCAGLLSGCSVLAVADATVSVVATGVSAAAKVVGAAVDLVVPDDDEKK